MCILDSKRLMHVYHLTLCLYISNISLETVEGRKVQVGKDQEKAQSEKDSHSKNRGGKNQTNKQVLIP